MQYKVNSETQAMSLNTLCISSTFKKETKTYIHVEKEKNPQNQTNNSHYLVSANMAACAKFKTTNALTVPTDQLTGHCCCWAVIKYPSPPVTPQPLVSVHPNAP